MCYTGIADSDNPEIEKAIEKGRRAEVPGAVLAHAWRTGEGLEQVDMDDFESNYLKLFFALCMMKRGNVVYAETLLWALPDGYPELERFYEKLLSMLPENRPQYDFRADYCTRLKQAKALSEWLDKNAGSIKRDGKKDRYLIQETGR